MQDNLPSPDARPRPRIHSSAVRRDAATAFVEANPIHSFLGEYSKDDEDMLAGKFTRCVEKTDKEDSLSLALQFARDLSDTTNSDFLVLTERFYRFLSQEQHRLEMEWMSSQSLADPVPSPARVLINTYINGMNFRIWGFTVPASDLQRLGKAAFIADKDLAKGIDREGRITGLRAVKWENILKVQELTEADAAVVAGHVAAVELSKLSATKKASEISVHVRRKALIDRNRVSVEEAERLYASLGLGDDLEAAAKAANAIRDVILWRLVED